MINANELKIGNYVYYKHPTTDLLIHKIEWLDFKEIHRFPDIYNEYHKPIQLTEEILLKCGFSITESIFHDNTNAYEIKSWGRIVLINGILQSDEFYFLDGLSTEIKYLHQLQNLYFALTNEELTIQL